MLGACFALVNAVSDLGYGFLSPFYSKTLFVSIMVFLALRIVVILGLSQYYFIKFVSNYKPDSFENNQ